MSNVRLPSLSALPCLVVLLLLLLLTPARSQSRGNESSSSSSSTGGAAPPAFVVFPIARLSYHSSYQPVGPQFVTFDADGNLVVVYRWATSVAVVYDVSSTSNATLLDMYPWGDGFSGSWSQAVVYQNQSGPEPVTVVLGPSDTRMIEFTAPSSNLSQWLIVPGSELDYGFPATLSYPNLSSQWSYTAIALDQRLGLYYTIVQPCNAAFQYQISATTNQTLFTQTLTITGANPPLNQPIGIAVDSSSMLYVADSSNRVVQFNSAGKQLAVLIDSNSSSFVSFPQFLIDPSTRDLLVVDTTYNVVRRWSRDGKSNTTFRLPTARRISSLAVNKNGDFFILDTTAWSVTIVPAAEAAPPTWTNSNAGMSLRNFSPLLFVFIVFSGWMVLL